MPGIEGSPLDPGDIWPVVTLASVNQTSVREVCTENREAPCDDTVFDWLHTLDRGRPEFAANLLFMQLAMTILDRSGSRIASIDLVDNPYHGTYGDEEGELCRMSPKDGTTTYHRYCTAYLVASGKPVTLAMTYVRSDEKQAERSSASSTASRPIPSRSSCYWLILASTTSASSAAHERSPRQSCRSPFSATGSKRSLRHTNRT